MSGMLPKILGYAIIRKIKLFLAIIEIRMKQNVQALEQQISRIPMTIHRIAVSHRFESPCCVVFCWLHVFDCWSYVYGN